MSESSLSEILLKASQSFSTQEVETSGSLHLSVNHSLVLLTLPTTEVNHPTSKRSDLEYKLPSEQEE